jgi:hypothetical protein
MFDCDRMTGALSLAPGAPERPTIGSQIRHRVQEPDGTASPKPPVWASTGPSSAGVIA